MASQLLELTRLLHWQGGADFGAALDEPAQDFRRLVTSDRSHHPVARAILGSALALLAEVSGDASEALEFVLKLVERVGREPYSLCGLAEVQFAAGRGAEAVETLVVPDPSARHHRPVISSLIERRLTTFRAELAPDLASYPSIDLAVDGPVPIISEGEEWGCFRENTEPPEKRMDKDFNEQDWEILNGGFGYGEGVARWELRRSPPNLARPTPPWMPSGLRVVRFLLSGWEWGSDVPVVFEYADGEVGEGVLRCDAWGNTPGGDSPVRQDLRVVLRDLERMHHFWVQGDLDANLFEAVLLVDPEKDLVAFRLEVDRAWFWSSETTFNLLAATGIRLRR